MPYTRGQFALGLEGLGLLRAGPFATDATLQARVDELTALAAALEDPTLAADAFGDPIDVSAGYALWADRYDEAANPLLDVEAPIVTAAIERWPRPARVLDVACGTGRHAARLAALGHDVTGIDGSPAMLARARAAVPSARLVDGPMAPLPFADGEFDAALCCLALSHCPDPGPPLAELGRVVRPGGPVLVSDFHPVMVLLGGQAGFRAADGHAHFVPSYAHTTGPMLRALDAADLGVLACDEPAWTRAAATTTFPGMSDALYDEAIAGLPLGIVWHLERRAAPTRGARAEPRRATQ